MSRRESGTTPSRVSDRQEPKLVLMKPDGIGIPGDEVVRIHAINRGRTRDSFLFPVDKENHGLAPSFLARPPLSGRQLLLDFRHTACVVANTVSFRLPRSGEQFNESYRGVQLGWVNVGREHFVGLQDGWINIAQGAFKGLQTGRSDWTSLPDDAVEGGRIAERYLCAGPVRGGAEVQPGGSQQVGGDLHLIGRNAATPI